MKATSGYHGAIWMKSRADCYSRRVSGDDLVPTSILWVRRPKGGGYQSDLRDSTCRCGVSTHLVPICGLWAALWGVG